MKPIVSISYQKKITAYSKEGGAFPSEVNIVYVVGDNVVLNMKNYKVKRIKEVLEGYEVILESKEPKLYTLSISKNKDVEILYGNK